MPTRPEALASAAAAYEALAASLEAVQQEWQLTVTGTVRASDWQGTASERAARTLDAAATRLQEAEEGLQQLAEALRQAAEDFAAHESDGASHQGGPGQSGTGQSGTEHGGAGQGGTDQADRRTATRLDQLTRLATTLHTTTPDTPTPFGPHPDALLLGLPGQGPVPPPGTPPGKVALWWQTLDPAARSRLTTGHPDLIGSLDGLPALVRDRANRLLLAQLLERGPRDAQLLDGLRAIRRRLADGPSDLLLLALSPVGHGRAVLSFGDPDHAAHVAAYVPGFGTKLAALGGGDADRAQRVRDAAAGYGEGRSVAALVWLGYDPPPNEGLDPRSLGVADDRRAREGAAAYERFLTGLRAARPGPPAHLTAIGHSYGSLLVGLAARQPGGPVADDVVLVGSPGAGTDRADGLGLAPGHVYVGAADCDPVSHLPDLPTVAGGMLAGGLPGAVLRQLVDPPDELWFGRDPAGSGFGARRFQVAPGEPLDAFASHSAYFDADSESLANIGRIVAGQGDRISPAPGR
ncbi:alpha/beta hydrolase [Kitasatospora sp. McL0602]|uniref:alpha/beta hydrolase n=1 Tax=Kitasatospora sp. McL0602 TaxID=3439530 RepID=UPI003F8C1F69